MAASTRKVILTDYVAFLLVIAAPISVALLVGAMLFGGLPRRSGGFVAFSDIRLILLVLATAVTIVTVPFLVRRVASFQQLFEAGREVPGAITTIWFVKDRGRVEYEFELEGKRYAAWNAVMKNKATAALHEGQAVMVLVDANNPKRSAIRHLYAASAQEI